MNDIKEQLTEILGAETEISKYSEQKSLPLYLTGGREIYEADIYGVRFLLVVLGKDANTDSRILKNQADKYAKVTGLPAVFCFSEFTRQQRTAYIKHNIPFIDLPDQVYLPFLGVLLTDRFVSERKKISEQLSPNAQSLFLLLMYSENEWCTKKEAAADLNLSPANISSASAQLRELGLIVESRHGKEIRMSLASDKRDIFAKSEAHLINPVLREIPVFKSSLTDELAYAGESALSRVSMLNEPLPEIRAVYSKKYKADDYLIAEEPTWEKAEEITRLQIWKYDPQLFSRNGNVDIISLYCSLLDERDERIQGELEEALEEYQWQ